MVRLREIPRAATFAWSPGAELPWIATGTKAGAVDDDFSNEVQLELWNLGLENPIVGAELQPAATVETDSRFYDIAWGKASNDHGMGIIAGALENGSLDLWDAKTLMDGASGPLMSRTSKHSGAIKSLQFNPFRGELLATAGARGELFISDLNNVANPFRLGSSAARADDFESVDWNKKVPHILATGSSGGFVTVWDVKAKKESLTLKNVSRKAISAVAWDPQNSTKLVTAVSDDSSPLIVMWDLRNSNAPERTLQAHDQGILSLSWCQQDSDLLLSCGKDNRTICWNPSTGQPYGEFPIVTNWTFQTQWNPHNPNLVATASFDGKIGIQTIQNTKSGEDRTLGARQQPLNDEDFFNVAQSQPQGAAFSLPKPPKWLERPVGASFGFGGKIVSFGLAAGGTRRSQIRISTFAIDSGVGTATETFESALKQGDFASICKSKIDKADSDEEKEDWKVIETLISTNPRKELVDHLGFSRDTDEAVDGIAKLKVSDGPAKAADKSATHPNGTKKGHRSNLSGFFDTPADGDTFLSDLSATKGAKTNNPFHIYTGAESSVDKRITRALMLGQFEAALDVCLGEDRMSDAFMIAICGGQKCIDKAQAAYFNKNDNGPNYLRLLASVVGKNLWDVVYNADLSNWREVMATLCTFADQNEFPDLCEALGDRLEEEMKHDSGNTALRKDACFCYLAGSQLEKVVAIWIEELHESETAGLQRAEAESTFSVHARSLQNFIEKVTVFREVTRYRDLDQSKSSGWKLAALYDKYNEYADVVAAHGHLDTAEKYLDLLPAQYAAAEVARNRVKEASKRAAPQTATRQAGFGQRIINKPLPGVGASHPPQPGYPSAPTPGGDTFTPAGPTQASNPYAPSNMPGYQPSGYQPGYPQAQPQRPTMGAPPPPSFAGYASGQTVGGPPRNINTPPSVPPPSRAANMSNWNDTPMVTKPPTSRRGTPGAAPAPVMSPFPNQPNVVPQGPPTGPPSGVQARSTPPLAPPPKSSSGPPPSFGAPPMQPPPQVERPPSAVTNAYAPPPGPIATTTSPPTGPRGPSPYNPPPSSAPPSNRYAPSPVSQTSPQSDHPGANFLSGPPPNQYNPYQAPGDRSHIPDHARAIYEILQADMQRVSAKAPASFKAQVQNTEKRLNMLFDHLNNEELLKPDTVESMDELAQSLRNRDYDTAQAIHLDILTNKLDQCGQWMVGVKRLIAMSRATP
ncbi:MAG: protein transport protein S31 [Thelocarpon superellum]|nr:MAG: protein transport protein S31 [Thelocarpon superellum]